MDFLSLFTGSENLYKYLLIGGLGFIALSLFYPINKRYELACQKDLYANQVKIINLEIDNLNKKIETAKINSDHILHVFDSLDVKKINNVKLKQILKDSANRQNNAVIKAKNDIEMGLLKIDYNKQRTITLDNHIEEFTHYKCAFIITGILFSIAGVLGWFLLMLKAHKKDEQP